jgi:uncharacterized phage infection (PIP) family protein YhgE
MEVLKRVSKNKLFIIGLLIPIIFQIVYLCIAVPAIKDGNEHIKDLKVTIVNEDNTLGKQISTQLSQVLPFKIEESSDLNTALDVMNEGDTNMVLYIAADFTMKVQQGGAQISYYINQSAPAMTKQAMEKTALSINQTLNENVFNTTKDAIKQNSAKVLSQTGLPEAALAQISSNISKAFDALKYSAISGDIQKVNNADGFAQSVLPFFLFLIYFVSCIILTILHILAYQPLLKVFSRAKILLSQLIVNVIMSLVLPGIAIGLAACFNIAIVPDIWIVWLMLSAGFFTLLYVVQMFASWFGIPGMGIAALLLFPLQLVSSGLIYSREILPGFYTWISSYLPATYLGDGMLKMFYGGPSVTKDIWILLLMAAIFMIVTALSALKQEKA